MFQKSPKTNLFIIFVMCIAFIQSTRITDLSGKASSADNIFLPLVMGSGITGEQIIYTSTNLSGHDLFAECNPGGGTNCPCSSQDVGLASFDDYGEVTSNVRAVNTYVNAIGYKQFTERFDNGEKISLSTYKYKGQFSIYSVPAQNVYQQENGQAVHLMIQLWDGRNALYESDGYSLEGVIYWDLNPWEPDYGKIMVYTYPPLQLVETGIFLEPDTKWHTFELIVDLTNQRYLKVKIDGSEKDLQGIGLAKVYHPEWGDDLSLSVTTESLATWPKYNCEYIFTWRSRFKNLQFSSLP